MEDETAQKESAGERAKRQDSASEGAKGRDSDGERAKEEESAAERANRELIELLNELRVALPGVQVLFAFLLTVPFAQGFVQLDASDRRVYFSAVVATVAATICLMAPTAHHRLRFRARVKEQLLKVANIFAIVGLVFLAYAIGAVTYVITDVLYPGTAPRIVTAVLAGVFIIVWFVLPAFYRTAKTPEPRPPGGG
jgi:Family of unknown function (DUF6328)